MKVAGVISEYNPFHNGHQYQLKELRRLTQADYIITAMSGDFLQRGVPALLDKHTRAEMALHGGCDLVLELPVLWATASAEYFASAGVCLLGSTGVVDVIGYGTECPPSLQKYLPVLAELLVNDSECSSEYEKTIAALQKDGLSYPSARIHAIRRIVPDDFPSDFLQALELPNNILALEYEKAICRWNATHTRQLTSCPIVRLGDGYHQTDITSEYASATAIRQILTRPSNTGIEMLQEQLAPFVPATTLDILTVGERTNRLINPDDCSQMLYYRLLSLADSPKNYTVFADCNNDLAHKICKHLNSYVTFTQFIELLKSRDLTYTRISRVLLHILLQLKNSDYRLHLPKMDSSYLRVLGFCNASASLLTEIKKKGSACLVTKVADASSILSGTGYELFQKDVFAADCYRGLVSTLSGELQNNEFNQPLIITKEK